MEWLIEEWVSCPKCKVNRKNPISATDDEYFYTCKCGHEFSREKTKKEIQWGRKDSDDLFKESVMIHKIYNAFNRWFRQDRQFQYRGYILIQRLEKFARYYPEVKLVSCDDDIHSSSCMALIPHYEKNGVNWGTTVVCAPQFGEPTVMFLYPENNMQMIKSLQEMRRK